MNKIRYLPGIVTTCSMNSDSATWAAFACPTGCAPSVLSRPLPPMAARARLISHVNASCVQQIALRPWPRSH